MYQQGLQLTVLKVLSTTQSVANAYTVNCPNGAIESVCIGALAFHLPANPAKRPSLHCLLLCIACIAPACQLRCKTFTPLTLIPPTGSVGLWV